MEFLMDPSIWAGLLTLVVLEIVLGIDNLVFIAILADKLPPKQRDKARIIGLSLALLMRLGLLSVISWMVTLTTPLFSVGDFSFSGRDLILLFGGVFLLFKATMELHGAVGPYQGDHILRAVRLRQPFLGGDPAGRSGQHGAQSSPRHRALRSEGRGGGHAVQSDERHHRRLLPGAVSHPEARDGATDRGTPPIL